MKLSVYCFKDPNKDIKISLFTETLLKKKNLLFIENILKILVS